MTGFGLNPVSGSTFSKQTCAAGGKLNNLILNSGGLMKASGVELTDPRGGKRSPNSWGDRCGTTVCKLGGSGAANSPASCWFLIFGQGLIAHAVRD